MDHKLLPCPFCGSEPVLFDKGYDHDFRYGVGCPNFSCFLWVPDDIKAEDMQDYMLCYEYYWELAENWNTRRWFR